MCNIGSGSSGRWCGTCWSAGAPASTWQGEPGPLGGDGGQPFRGGPDALSPPGLSLQQCQVHARRRVGSPDVCLPGGGRALQP